MVSRPPTPLQRANDSTTEAIAGSHTQPRTMIVGTATIRIRKIRSVPVTRTRRPARRRGTAASAVAAGTVGRSLIGASPPHRLGAGHEPPDPRSSGGEDGLLLALQALGQPVDVVGVLEERLDAGEHHRLGEVGPGVTVQELGDRLGRADELDRLLLQPGVGGGVGLAAGPDDRRVGLEGDVLGLGRAQVLEQLLGPLLVLGVGPHHEAVDRGLDRARADRRVDLGEGEEVEVVLLLALGELLAHEHAQQVHPRLLLQQRLGRLLPGPPEGGLLVVGQQPLPGVEHLLDLGRVPGLLAGHQVDVELVAVDTQVELVEGAHGRPAVLVGEGDRDQAVLVHLLGQGDQLVEGLGGLVALLLPDRLAVEDRPRVGGQGHEVLLAVVAGGGLLEGLAHPREAAVDVTDVAGQALGGEEPHPVAGEPGEHVVGVALQVVVDVLLEGVVVDGVDLHGHPRGGQHVGVGLLGHRVGLVGAEGHLLAGAAATAVVVATAAGREQAGERHSRSGAHGPLEEAAAAEAGRGHRRRDETGEVLGLRPGTGHGRLPCVALGRRGRGPEGTCGGSGQPASSTRQPAAAISATTSGSAVASVIRRLTSSMSHTLASSTSPTLEPSATITRRLAASSMARLTSASGRLTLVMPTSGSTPLQPTKATAARRRSSRVVPSGLTSECWRGRRVPPVTTTLMRGAARSSSRAMLSPLVTTVTSFRSLRSTSARAMAVVVVPTSRITVSPGAIIAAACTPMLDFWTGASHCDDSKGRSPSPDGGTAPPRTRRTRARASSAVRSARTVTADTPNRPARSLTRANPSCQMIPAMRAWRTSASGLSSETPALPDRSPMDALLRAPCTVGTLRTVARAMSSLRSRSHSQAPRPGRCSGCGGTGCAGRSGA